MAELPPGQILGGKYTLQALLRRAPWGSTHRAITSPNREVVIKVLDAGLAARPDVLLAIRKAETAGAALPVHLALRVVEQGIDSAVGVPYIVTPTAATPSLEQLVALCALSPAEAVSFAQNLGRALDALHFAGYQHLALKPSNVFVGPTPECAVQLADFGANATRAMLDRDAQLGFEAPWLAPEQIDGDEKAGTEADVFAAALVTFFAMTGRSLWRSCRGTAVDVAAWRAEIARPAPRASEAASEVGAVVAPAFDVAFAGALASPETRIKSVSVFAELLAEALASVQPAPPALTSNDAVATAISLPPDAIEAEPAEAPKTHTPTLSPPAGQSLPPAPERAVAAPAAAGVAGAVQAPSRHGLARPHTVPYWDEVASPPAEHDPFPPAPPPVAGIAAPVDEPVQAAPASASSASATPTLPPREPGRRWLAVAAGVALGVVVGVLAFGRAGGFSFRGTPATEATPSAEPAPPTSLGLPAATGASAGPAESAAPAAGSAGPTAVESAAPIDSAMPPMVVAPARPDDAQLTVVCEPACDLVAVDSRRMTDYPEPVRLRPGVHGVGASRAHYGGQWKQVSVRAGEKATVTFSLSPSTGGKKPCGQFLKRCRD